LNPHWHPLATIYIKSPASVATPLMLRMLLTGEGQVELVYAGDSMWPAIEHGQSLLAKRPGEGALQRGSLLLILVDSIPDVLRLEREEGEQLHLSADSGNAISLPRESLLGELTLSPSTPTSPMTRARNRFALDLGEAWNGAVDEGAGAAESVRTKYDSLAGFYAGREGVRLDPSLLKRIQASEQPGARIVVVGSGAGHECIALAEAGYEAIGIEFAEAMVDHSRREAESAGVTVEFVQADIRQHEEPAASIDLVLFTYDVYSFIPSRQERVRMLQRMRDWLKPTGSILLSARRADRNYERAIVSLQWLSALRRGAAPEWGDSHTRWLTTTGQLRRSFVRVFSERQLRAEVAEAALQGGHWQQGHQRLRLL
jgi:SAM-dependent methyltransferase